MERRRESRFITDQPVWVTVLGNFPVRFFTRTLDWSGRGIRILTPHHIQPGSPVKIELDDSIVLAEVCFCSKGDSAQDENTLVAGLKIDQILRGITALTKLNMRLLGDWRSPQTPAELTTFGSGENQKAAR